MLNENIKRLRKSKGLSQEELAIKLNVVRQTVSKWENGGGMPDISLLLPLCEILDITVEELMDGKKSAPKETKKSRIAGLGRKKYTLTKKQVLSILCLLLSVLGVFM